MYLPMKSRAVIRFAALVLLLGPIAPVRAETARTATGCRSITVYTRPGCPHCAAARTFLDEFSQRHPEVRVEYLDITANALTLERFRELSANAGVDPPGVPTFDICGAVIVGFGNAGTTGLEIEQAVEPPAPAEMPPGGEPPDSRGDTIEIPWIGTLSAGNLGMPLFTLVIGLIDGFNPCAMWVLLFLLSLLVNLKSRRKILLVAGTFVTVSGLAYLAFMAAWLNVFLLAGFSRPAQIVLGLVAGAIGLVHVRDSLKPGSGVSLSIPEAAKPAIYSRVRRIVQADNLWGALAGAAVLAVLVNLVELLCTAGLPALYTHVLAGQGYSVWVRYGYLVLYIAAYMFDDALMVALVVITLDRHKLQEREGRWLKLLSGAVILILGVLLIFRPEWLF